MAITNIQEEWLEKHPVIAYAQKHGITLNFGMVTIIMLFIFWIYTTRKVNKKITKRHQKSLDTLITQSRHVVMGEMIAMLTHQWKQPLTALMLKTGTVRDKIQMLDIEDKDQKFLTKNLEGVESLNSHIKCNYF